MTDPRYPIGKFERRDELNPDERRAMIETISAAPSRMREAVAGLGDTQLDTPYRDGGWTVRQVIHHVPDSHLNAYTRLKLALTENDPTIRPYDEALWAGLPDSRDTPTEVSLTLLESLHARWVTLLRSLGPDDFRRTFRHPDHPGILTVDWLVAMYAWHSRHHVGHITSLRERMRW
ncbi:MAG TPA: putative metal-dependent hydrolase [Thermoanaerobaculia bacterium]